MKSLTASALAAFVLGLSVPVQADTVRDEILSGAAFFDSSGCQILNIDFNFPTRVVAHYPFSKGNELRIELAGLTGNGDTRSQAHRREALDPPKDSTDLVSGITYEGSAVPRPYLRLTFRHAVDFKVGQGKDFRSVVVAFRQPQGSGVCEPVYPANDE